MNILELNQELNSLLWIELLHGTDGRSSVCGSKLFSKDPEPEFSRELLPEIDRLVVATGCDWLGNWGVSICVAFCGLIWGSVVVTHWSTLRSTRVEFCSPTTTRFGLGFGRSLSLRSGLCSMNMNRTIQVVCFVVALDNSMLYLYYLRRKWCVVISIFFQFKDLKIEWVFASQILAQTCPKMRIEKCSFQQLNLNLIQICPQLNLDWI